MPNDVSLMVVGLEPVTFWSFCHQKDVFKCCPMTLISKIGFCYSEKNGQRGLSMCQSMGEQLYTLLRHNQDLQQQDKFIMLNWVLINDVIKACDIAACVSSKVPGEPFFSPIHSANGHQSGNKGLCIAQFKFSKKNAIFPAFIGHPRGRQG